MNSISKQVIKKKIEDTRYKWLLFPLVQDVKTGIVAKKKAEKMGKNQRWANKFCNG